MGFFKDFKRDFAQAVNELMPDKEELAEEYDDEDMVNTFDESDSMDVAPEDMLEDLDDFKIDTMSDDVVQKNAQTEKPESDYEEDDEEEPKNIFDNIPKAEVINDSHDDSEDIADMDLEKEAELITEILVAEPVPEKEGEDNPALASDTSDELVAVDELDESNMLEGMEDVVAVEKDGEEARDELSQMNLNQDVMAAIMMREDAADDEKAYNDMEDDNMADAKLEEQNPDINSILNDDTTYITKGTTIKGDIETDGSIDIIGTVEGDVTCEGKLIVGGTIKGSVNAGEIYANAAKIEGEVIADGSAKIGVGSVVVGNVTATSAVVAGAVNGDIDVKGPVIVDSTAVIMGNIKSRSVQINNGAVIEGFCSQCYSEIDVKSFFE